MSGSYNCPICNSAMLKLYGNKMHPGEPNFGITLRCIDSKCPTAENVEGHGKNEARAYDVVLAKWAGRSLEQDEVNEEIPAESKVVEVTPPVKHGKRGRPPKKALPVVAAEEEPLPL